MNPREERRISFFFFVLGVLIMLAAFSLTPVVP